MSFLSRNSKSANIEHQGHVVQVTPETIEVNILSVSACAACHAKGFCSVFDQKDKNVTIPNIGQDIHVGDKVNVQMKQSLGTQAVVLAYLVPVAVVIVSLLLLVELKVSELMSGLLSLGALGIYYFILYLFRNKLKKVYNFHIIKIG